MAFGVNCARGSREGRRERRSFDDIPEGRMRPIYFLDDRVRQARHRCWVNIVKEEEREWNFTASSQDNR